MMVISSMWILQKQPAGSPQVQDAHFSLQFLHPGKVPSGRIHTADPEIVNRGPLCSWYTHVSKLAYNAVLQTGASGCESCSSRCGYFNGGSLMIVREMRSVIVPSGSGRTGDGCLADRTGPRLFPHSGFTRIKKHPPTSAEEYLVLMITFIEVYTFLILYLV